MFWLLSRESVVMLMMPPNPDVSPHLKLERRYPPAAGLQQCCYAVTQLVSRLRSRNLERHDVWQHVFSYQGQPRGQKERLRPTFGVLLMWRTGCVGTANFRSHMPNVKIRQLASGPYGPPSLMVFTIADVRELNPERGRGAKGPLSYSRTTLARTNVFRRSPRETRGRLCGGTSLPHTW